MSLNVDVFFSLGFCGRINELSNTQSSQTSLCAEKTCKFSLHASSKSSPLVAWDEDFLCQWEAQRGLGNAMKYKTKPLSRIPSVT